MDTITKSRDDKSGSTPRDRRRRVRLHSTMSVIEGRVCRNVWCEAQCHTLNGRGTVRPNQLFPLFQYQNKRTLMEELSTKIVSMELEKEHRQYEGKSHSISAMSGSFEYRSANKSLAGCPAQITRSWQKYFSHILWHGPFVAFTHADKPRVVQ